jgi:hypothetical protein
LWFKVNRREVRDMLTGFQVEVVAYLGDGAIYCPECVDDQELPGTKNEAALIRYTVDEEFACGLSCDSCGAEIVDSDHDWLDAGETCDDCGYENTDEPEPDDDELNSRT